MANLNIEIQISARDQASSVLKGIQGSLGAIGGFARGALALGFGAATAAAGALGVGLGISIREAMEAQEVQAQLANVLRSTGGVAGVTADMANELANSLMGVTRFGDEAILSGENMLLTFTNIGKDVFPEATEVMLDMSQALGQDIKSSAIQLGKALQDPIQGVTALRRVGVNFTEDQQKMIESMVESGDLMGAQKFILQELKTEFGGSARAAGETFAGQLDILKNSLLNVAEGIGTALLPIAQDFLQNTILPMLPAIQELAEKFGTLVTTLFKAGPLSSEFGEALGAMFGEETATQIQTIIGWLAENIHIAIERLKVFWVDILQPAIEQVWNWMSSVLIPFLADTVYPWLKENIPKAIQILSDFWTNILKPAIEQVWNWISNVLIPFLADTVYPWLKENIPKAIQILSDFWTNTLKPAIEQVWNWMSSVLIPFLADTVYPWLKENIPKAIQILSDFWTNTLKPAIEAIWDFINTYLIPIFMEVKDIVEIGLTVAIGLLKEAWENILLPALILIRDFLRDEIGPKLVWLKDHVIIPLTSAIGEGLQKALDWILEKLGKLKEIAEKVANALREAGLLGDSPSAFELSLRGINEELKNLNAISSNMPLFNLERQILAQSSPASNISTAQQFNLTIYSNARREDLVSDFGLMRALAEG